MTRTLYLIAAAAIALTPAAALAGPPAPGSISPHHDTGQPLAECGEDGAFGSPGNAVNAPGSPFNEDGISGQHYAGEQDQNSKNTASISQYDAACLHTAQH